MESAFVEAATPTIPESNINDKLVDYAMVLTADYAMLSPVPWTKAIRWEGITGSNVATTT